MAHIYILDLRSSLVHYRAFFLGLCLSVWGYAMAGPGHDHANHDRAFLKWAEAVNTSPSSGDITRGMLVGSVVSVMPSEQKIEIKHEAVEWLGLQKGTTLFRYETAADFVNVRPNQRLRLAMIHRKDGAPTIERLDRVLDGD